MTEEREMPRYRSHKQVWALQIARVNDTTIHFVEPGFPPVVAEPEMFVRYMPSYGDYYIVYKDGYKSISPKQAFEDGYYRV